MSYPTYIWWYLASSSGVTAYGDTFIKKYENINNDNDDASNVGSDISSSVYNDDYDDNDIRVEEDVEINSFN